MFSIIKTRPDIAFSVIVAICFIKNPSYSHFKANKTIVMVYNR